ncbi:DoxX family protein [Sphingomonas oleivorans]|uniref:DoxX family protein n=1 Tax=Sphingomonas oleivorans TaxID=1735121 RepID=A0A2T5G2C4_9SPHN|nr:DoxX family protein [Sphingomonas oleivorans]PTQ13297.1 DoxX family protein [Sphingomonas oleivorans]
MTSTSPISAGPVDANIWAPRLLSVLRVVTGLLFLSHGVVKLFGFPAGAQPGQVPLFGLYGLAGMLELVGGLLIVLGLFTRPVAFLLSGEMAIAYFMAHAPQSVFPVLNGGEAAILFCFIFLHLAVAGAGPWSLDASRRA